MKKLIFAFVILMVIQIGTASAASLSKNIKTVESYIKNPKSVSRDNALKAFDEILAYIGESETTYILNTDTMKFHFPTCRYADKINDEHREEYTGTRDELIERDYEPCKVCNP